MVSTVLLGNYVKKKAGFKAKQQWIATAKTALKLTNEQSTVKLVNEAFDAIGVNLKVVSFKRYITPGYNIVEWVLDDKSFQEYLYRNTNHK